MIREHMTPERHSEGYKIVGAIQNAWEKNRSLSRNLPDLNDQINKNLYAVINRFDLTMEEWYLWCKNTPPLK